MQRKVKFEVYAVISILLLSIGASCLQQCYATAQVTSPQNYSTFSLNFDGLSLKEHKMTAAELEDYQNSVGTYQENQNYNRVVSGHGMGLCPPTASEWANIAKNAYVVDKISYAGTLPDVVDLSQSAWFPPIGDQGEQGACSFFANVYYAKTYQEAKEHQWNLSQATWVYDGSDNFEYSPGHFYDNGHIASAYQNQAMSPAFVYNLINNGTDMGGSLEAPIMIMCSIGASSWQNMPYNQSECTDWPSEAAWAEAPYYRSDSTYSYQYIYVNQTDGVTNLKNWLAAGNVATFAIDAYDNLNPIPTNNTQDLFTLDNWVFGGLDHAQTIVGYNDGITYMENGSLHNGAFKIVNSWGINGPGSPSSKWENVADGCYWMSYQALAKHSAVGSPVIISQDLIGYQPQILATFNINHAAREDCNITFGLGNPDAPLVTKTFDQVTSGGDLFLGGNLPYPPNNIVFDLTEFKDYTNHLYNQPFFMQVYDADAESGGTGNTGTINLFAVGNTASTQTPIQTVNNGTVTLMLNYSLASPTLTVSPTSGTALGAINLCGTGFTGNSVNISYQNPATSTWIPLANNIAISENFSYATQAPDLLQNNPAGDNTAASNNIFFRATDGDGNSYTTNVPYTEMRRGLVQISNQTAAGIWGNGTNLATTVFVQNSQPIVVAGKWFTPGNAELFWDSTISLGSATVDAMGTFNATVTVPATTAGNHSITINDGTAFCVNITRLPTLSSSYVDLWHTSDFTINLTSDFAVTQTYYKINGGITCSVSTNGQPTITVDGNNTLEYWSIWSVYGSGTMELPHATLTGIKLDKTAPAVSLQINGGAATTGSTAVNLTLTANDSVSGVSQMRLSNNGAWDDAPWQPYSRDVSWQLSSGDGVKTIYCQIKDNAGLIANTTASIVLNKRQTTVPTTSTPNPTTSATPQPSPTPQVPELNIQIILALLAAIAAFVATIKYTGKKRQ